MKSTTEPNYISINQQITSTLQFQYFHHPKSIISNSTEIDYHQYLFYLDQDFFPNCQESYIAYQSSSIAQPAYFRQERDVQEPVFQLSQGQSLERQTYKVESLRERQIASQRQDSEIIQLQIEKDQSQDKSLKDLKCNKETKNVPKNYIKAIFAFALQNEEIMAKMMKQLEVKGDFVEFVRMERKIKCYTIERLKSLWNNEVFGGVMRVLSNYFLRRRCWSYIFGSKIATKGVHLKYRLRLMDGVRNPNSFNNIK